MFESMAFFEPYRAILQALQDFNGDSFPMIEPILGREREAKPPLYLDQQSSSVVYKLKGVAKDNNTITVPNPMALTSWPPAVQLGLDEKQHRALHAALTSHVALIQGPPGTGKTFLAVRILRSLLANKALWQDQATGTDKLQQSLRNSIESGKSFSWNVKNKLFWRKEKFRDPRSPVLVVCLTVGNDYTFNSIV